MSSQLKSKQLDRDLTSLEGYRWMPNGESVFNGKLATLYNHLDAMFFGWAEDWSADSYLFPSFIPAKDLAKVQYFHSFPQLATFPVVLDKRDSNIREFVSRLNDSEAGVPLTQIAEVHDVLTPAACYHFYPQFSAQSLSSTKYVTTRTTCHRSEDYYEPLRRQWSFSMREIVCIGSEEEVKEFLLTMQTKMQRFFERIQLDVSFQTATDPFFDPSKNPKYIFQKVQPVKTEMVFGGDLAIGSFNFHRNHFGHAFQIKSGETEAFSGCVAFGLERWIYAYLSRFGLNEDQYIFE